MVSEGAQAQCVLGWHQLLAGFPFPLALAVPGLVPPSVVGQKGSNVCLQFHPFLQDPPPELWNAVSSPCSPGFAHSRFAIHKDLSVQRGTL